MKTSQNMVLRTVYISPELDNQLRVEAFDKRTSKNELIRKYLMKGMAASPLEESRSLANPTSQIIDTGSNSKVDDGKPASGKQVRSR